MKLLIRITPLFFLFATSTLLGQSLQQVMVNGNTTDVQLQHTNSQGILAINSNIQEGNDIYNSLLLGQYGTNDQFLRIVPFATANQSSLWSNAIYFDLQNLQWGIKGTLQLEDDVYFQKALKLQMGFGNALDFGSDWLSHVDETEDAFSVTHKYTGGSELKIINTDGNVANSQFLIGGNVGIGVATPSEKLDVNGNILIQDAFKLTTNKLECIRGEINLNNDAWNTGASSISSIGKLSIGLENNNNDVNSELIIGVNDIDPAGTNWETLFVIKNDGRVGIGTYSPSSTDMLTVAGAIHSQEVKVTVDAGTGPDYVFEADYLLTSLEELDQYI